MYEHIWESYTYSYTAVTCLYKSHEKQHTSCQSVLICRFEVLRKRSTIILLQLLFLFSSLLLIFLFSFSFFFCLSAQLEGHKLQVNSGKANVLYQLINIQLFMLETNQHRAVFNYKQFYAKEKNKNGSRMRHLSFQEEIFETLC